MAEFNYTQLRDIQKREMESSAIVNLPDEFYAAIATILTQKRQAAFESKSLSSIKEYENLRKILLAIQSKREEKIVLMALRGENGVGGLTREEQSMFMDIATIVSKSRIQIRSSWDGADASKTVSASGISGASGVSAASGVSDASDAETDISFVSIRVRIVKEVAQYKGLDNLVYGPFKGGEECALPKPEAEWLVKAGLAEAL